MTRTTSTRGRTGAVDRPEAVTRRRWTARSLLLLWGLSAALLGAVWSAAPASAALPLVRYPYLTDITTTSVQVTFDTSTKIAGAAGAVRYGTVAGGSCTASSSVSSTANTVNAPVTVAGVVEYATSVRLSGLQPGTTYCYRVTTGGGSGSDLLGSDASPQFRTLSPSSPVTFGVLGDWGDDSVAGGANQKNVLAELAGSGAQFAVSTGDIAYQDGTQTQYGNLVATGSRVSQVFGPSQWAVPGRSIPLFATSGNHGRSSTFLQNWRQAATVAASGGTYAMQTYSGQDGTSPASYPSVWYAFSAGGARFYVLQADWSESNAGTAAGGAYEVDRDYHWQTTSPEYQWLKADLAAHGESVKMAFFHYPLRADSATEPGDVFLQSDPDRPTAQDSLEGLLRAHGVDLAFNGHAHVYQRNLAPPGGVTSYVTGGGGGKASPVSGCSTTDAYAVGWSYTRGAGSSCGAASDPGSDAQVYHFLKVTVSGTRVTVTPTASTGATFDAKTYDFRADSTAPTAPAGLTATAAGTGVRLAWTASAATDVSAQDVYRDGRWVATVSPSVTTYTDGDPVAGATYTVRAHDLADNQSVDSGGAQVGGDSSAPSTPSGLTATAASATSVALSWSPATDDVGVTGYRVVRDGAVLTTVSPTSYTDNSAAAASTYRYQVQAVDAAGNASGLSTAATVTTPSGGGGGGGGTELTFTATDDATLDQTASTTNAGSSTRLSADASPVQDFLVRFAVTGTASCPVQRAALRMTVGTSANNDSVHGGEVYATDGSTWSQGSVTWANSPARSGAALASLPAVTLGQTVEVDVTRLVTGDGPLSLRVGSTSGDAAAYYSREGSTTSAPRLVISCGASTATTTTRTVVATGDATVASASPTATAGASTRLVVDGSPASDVLLRFPAVAPGCRVDRALLRLTVGSSTDDQSSSGGTVRVASAAWDEATVSWSSAPAASGGSVTVGAVALGTTYTPDITPLVSAGGEVGLRVVGTSSDGARYVSEEGGTADQDPAMVLTTTC